MTSYVSTLPQDEPTAQTAADTTAERGNDPDRRVPAWLRETETCLLTNPQLLLYGNIRDSYLVPDGSSWRSLDIREAVWWLLKPLGYTGLLVIDPVDGLIVLPSDPAAEALAKDLAGPASGSGRPLSLETMLNVLRGVAGRKDHRVAVMVDYASRLCRDSQQLSPEEHYFFAACEKLANTTGVLRQPEKNDATPRYNPVLWATNNARDLPSWFAAGNAAIRPVAVPLPDLGDRKAAAKILAGRLMDQSRAGEDPDEIADRFAEQTRSLTLRSMMEIIRLAYLAPPGLSTVEDAIRCYRVGVRDNPWNKPYLRSRLVSAPERLRSRVRGQEEAIGRSADILVRSVMGLSGAQTSANASRPRGSLFFAGPTGVGKTELAKALTQLIFGDESAYIRFDMSEFSAEHSAERLIGAPPGYVGHDAGGELTNAVRERPFSVILFDEIEKAHRGILDKFLQILDEGRLTDGTGSTVYFSEAVLIFTSNLGMKHLDDRGQTVPLAPDTPREELVELVSTGVREYFVDKLDRPELLNRLGDNIVVFNFVSPSVATEIFDLQVSRIVDLVGRELHVEIELAPEVRASLLADATKDLSMGGRGIGSQLETMLVNPLARALFAQGSDRPPHQTVTSAGKDEAGWRVTLG